MAMLKEKDRRAVAEALKDLAAPVTIRAFTQDFECETCSTTRELLEEVASLSDRLTLEVHDFVADKELADRMGIDKIPAFALLRGVDEDRGIRFYGVPAGYEFATLIEGIRMVASGDSKLAPESRAALAGLTDPVHLQVFVTPT